MAKSIRSGKRRSKKLSRSRNASKKRSDKKLSRSRNASKKRSDKKLSRLNTRIFDMESIKGGFRSIKDNLGQREGPLLDKYMTQILEKCGPKPSAWKLLEKGTWTKCGNWYANKFEEDSKK